MCPVGRSARQSHATLRSHAVRARLVTLPARQPHALMEAQVLEDMRVDEAQRQLGPPRELALAHGCGESVRRVGSRALVRGGVGRGAVGSRSCAASGSPPLGPACAWIAPAGLE